MTKAEAANILSNDIINGHVEGNADFMDAFWFAVDNLKAEPCEDAVSREAVTDTIIWYENGGMIGTKELLELIRRLPSVTPKQRWIPVSERLPEKTGLYLVSIGDLVTTGSFDGHNFRTQTMVRFVPDAWMPLPEPYKEGEEDG